MRLRRHRIPSGPRFSHHTLPDGTILTITSTKGSTFRVKLLPGVFEGHSRNVKVLDAPIQYDDSEIPTIMCVVGPKARVKLMGHAYGSALTDVGPGDTVYLIDRYAGGVVPKIRVQRVNRA